MAAPAPVPRVYKTSHPFARNKYRMAGLYFENRHSCNSTHTYRVSRNRGVSRKRGDFPGGDVAGKILASSLSPNAMLFSYQQCRLHASDVQTEKTSSIVFRGKTSGGKAFPGSPSPRHELGHNFLKALFFNNYQLSVLIKVEGNVKNTV